jgi:hypothetical protein
MTEEQVKRGYEEDEDGPLMRKLDPRDVEEDYEALVRFAAAQILRANKRQKLDEQHTVPPPRLTPLTRTDDNQTQHKSGYVITDGPFTYIIPVALLRYWNSYSTGDHLFVTPVPLRKIADAICAEYARDCNEGKEPAYPKKVIELLRDAFLEGDDAMRMCKNEKDFSEE